MIEPTESQVASYAEREVENCVDNHTNEVNATQLAENIAHHFGCDHWLDDETHFVWEIALTAGAEFENS